MSHIDILTPKQRRFVEGTEHSMSADLISMGRALSEMAARTPGNLSTDPRVLARLKGSD